MLPEVFVHLRPTAPFRRPGWIDEAVALLLAHPEADSVRSVSPPAQHPWRMFSIGPDGMLLPIMRHEHPTPYLPRRQDLPPVYYYNCVIDVTRRATLLGKRSMTGDRMFPFLMATDDAFDIDTRRDLEIAQALLREPR